ERLALGSVANDHEMGVPVREQSHRLDQVAVPLPAAQRRGDAHQWNAVRQTERPPGKALVARSEPLWVDAGGNRGHPRGRYAQIADQLLAYRLARGDDLGGGARIEPASASPIRGRRRDVASPHKRRRSLPADPEQSETEGREPAVGRAVGVDDIDPMPGEQPPQLDDSGRPLAPKGKRDARHFGAPGLDVDVGVAWTGEPDVVPAAAHSGGLGQDANLLTAPA